MRTCILVLTVVLSVIGAPNKLSPVPDFSWGDKYPALVRASLELSRSKWLKASAVPGSPSALKSAATLFDENYLGEILNRGNMPNASYDLLDIASRKLDDLDKSKTAFKKALTACKNPPPTASARFTDVYYSLHSNLKLAIGLARADISRQMIGDDTSSYCFQAMEASIDALRDSAADADKVPGLAKRAESIRKLRSTLFQIWEQAERSKDTRIIGTIDLRRAFNEAFTQIKTID